MKKGHLFACLHPWDPAAEWVALPQGSPGDAWGTWSSKSLPLAAAPRSAGTWSRLGALVLLATLVVLSLAVKGINLINPGFSQTASWCLARLRLAQLLVLGFSPRLVF